jgi:hypothetical protein
MFLQRVSAIALLCAVVLVAPRSVCHDQTVSKRPEASQRASATIPTQITEPHPDYGVIDGQHYVNGYFGFSYRYPDGWNGNAMQSSNSSLSRMYTLFTANPSIAGGSDMRYLSVNVDSLAKGATPKDFLEATVKTFAGPTGAFDVLHTDKQYTFGGKEFHRVDLVSRSAPGNPAFYQTQVFTLFPNYAVTFSFVTANPSDIENLVRSMESLNFAGADHSLTTAPVHSAVVVAQPK